MVWHEPKERKDVESLKNVGDWTHIKNVSALSCSYEPFKYPKVYSCSFEYKKPSESKYGIYTKEIDDVKLIQSITPSSGRSYIHSPSFPFPISDSYAHTSWEFKKSITCQIELTKENEKRIKC